MTHAVHRLVIARRALETLRLRGSNADGLRASLAAPAVLLLLLAACVALRFALELLLSHPADLVLAMLLAVLLGAFDLPLQLESVPFDLVAVRDCLRTE